MKHIHGPNQPIAALFIFNISQYINIYQYNGNRNQYDIFSAHLIQVANFRKITTTTR